MNEEECDLTYRESGGGGRGGRTFVYQGPFSSSHCRHLCPNRLLSTLSLLSKIWSSSWSSSFSFNYQSLASDIVAVIITVIVMIILLYLPQWSLFVLIFPIARMVVFVYFILRSSYAVAWRSWSLIHFLSAGWLLALVCSFGEQVGECKRVGLKSLRVLFMPKQVSIPHDLEDPFPFTI